MIFSLTKMMRLLLALALTILNASSIQSWRIMTRYALTTPATCQQYSILRKIVITATKFKCAANCQLSRRCFGYSFSSRGGNVPTTCTLYSSNRVKTINVVDSQNELLPCYMLQQCQTPPLCMDSSLFKVINSHAYGNNVSQSSDYGPEFTAKNVLNGDLNLYSRTGYPNGAMDTNLNPWWQIDFRKSYTIIGLTLVNRKSVGYRLHDFEVRVGNDDLSSNKTSNSLCHFHPDGGIPDGGSYYIICGPQAAVGRYLSVQIMKICNFTSCTGTDTKQNILSLALINIYGYTIL